MAPDPNNLENEILQRLDAAVRNEAARAAIAAIVARVEETMRLDPEATEAWEPIPLAVYDEPLPDEIRSSWVFILRAGMASGAEKHPHSRQRMTSWQGGGDFRVHDGARWRSHDLTSDPDAPLSRRWISIPADTWHQGVVGERDWVVVSFHTVPAAELVEERPGPTDPHEIRSRRYLDVRPA